jgi:hypothetical protein
MLTVGKNSLIPPRPLSNLHSSCLIVSGRTCAYYICLFSMVRVPYGTEYIMHDRDRDRDRNPAQEGFSCLHNACETASLDVVKFLCESGGEKLVMLQNMVRGLCCHVMVPCVFWLVCCLDSRLI